VRYGILQRMWAAQQVGTMRPDARKSQPSSGQAAGNDDRSTYPLPQASWPSPPPARVGRGSQPPRPIERPPSLRVIRDAPLVAPTISAPRRGRRALAIVLCIIVALVAAVLVVEAVSIAIGKTLF
jgi:hypothetical protein